MIEYKEMNNHYNSLFKQLDNILHNEKVSIKEVKPCCMKPDIRKDETFETCIHCGLVTLMPFDLERANQYHNQKFHLSTLLGGYNKKFFMINRIHRNTNHNYKETTLMKTLNVINNICKHFNLTGIVVTQSKNIYKNLYIDKKISSRSNIKKAVYIYCIFSSCLHNNINIKLQDLIDHMKIKIEHFEKCVKKIDDTLIFADRKIIKYLNICIDNKLGITEDSLLKNYGKNIHLKNKINLNSIIIGTIYNMVKEEVELKKFIKIFKTTKITLNKFNKLLE